MEAMDNCSDAVMALRPVGFLAARVSISHIRVLCYNRNNNERRNYV